MARRVALSWSGGKDSAMTLHHLHADPDVEVACLLTTVTEGYERISMHGVRVELLRRQATALGLPAREVRLPQDCSNEIYDAAMGAALADLQHDGITDVAFGDLHLADVRAYREERLAAAGARGVFPLWRRDTHAFVREFLDLGFQAIVVCIDPQALGPAFAGRPLDAAFLADLPPGVDPAGENGEFHTFVWDGPLLAEPVPVTVGERVERNGFWYCDLLPA
jgi:uncharacterized protein (TIGR00290 family)